MGFILDIIFVLLVVLFAFISAKKGFVRTLLEAIGLVASMLLSVWLAGIISNFLLNSLIMPNLESLIASSLEGAGNNVTQNLPAGVKTLLALSGVGDDFVSSALSTGAHSATLVICESITPFITNVVRTIAIICLFTVLSIVFKFSAKKANSLFNATMLSKVNIFLGAVLGSIKGFAFAVLFCVLVALALSTGVMSFGFFSPELINTSIICKTVLNFCSISV